MPKAISRTIPTALEQSNRARTTRSVHCTSTKGPFTLRLRPEWAPLGAARFLELVRDGFFDGAPSVFRVREGVEMCLNQGAAELRQKC